MMGNCACGANLDEGFMNCPDCFDRLKLDAEQQRTGELMGRLPVGYGIGRLNDSYYVHSAFSNETWEAPTLKEALEKWAESEGIK